MSRQSVVLRRADRLARLRFRCPACGTGEPRARADALRCETCGVAFPVRDGRPWFTAPSAKPPPDALDRLKSRFKRFRRLYGALVWLVSPLYFDGTLRGFLRDHVRGRDGVFLNLGSGNTRIDPRVVNLDIVPHECVDVVTDVGALPLQDGSVDVVLNLSVLEHVPRPSRVVHEIRRVLRPGGLVYSDVPFVVGYHASPRDFRRWTHEGVVELHRGFEALRVVSKGGPTSALLWVFQEWVAVLLSFGSRRLHAVVWLVVTLLTFPLKFLDVLLRLSPLARNVSACFVFVGRKPAAGP